MAEYKRVFDLEKEEREYYKKRAKENGYKSVLEEKPMVFTPRNKELGEALKMGNSYKYKAQPKQTGNTAYGPQPSKPIDFTKLGGVRNIADSNQTPKPVDYIRLNEFNKKLGNTANAPTRTTLASNQSASGIATANANNIIPYGPQPSEKIDLTKIGEYKANSTAMKPAKALGYGSERAAAGLLSVGEGITDFIGSVGDTALGDVFGFLGYLAGSTIGNGNKVSDFFVDTQKAFYDGAERFLDKSVSQDYEKNIEERYNPSRLDETVTGIGQGVVNMLPAIAANSVGTPVLPINNGLALLGTSSAGQSASEAYKKSGDVEKSLLYGALSGVTEVMIEKGFGGIPGLNDGVVSDIVNKSIKKPAIRNAISRITDVAGEGAEEALSTIISPYLERVTIDPNAPLAETEQIIESAITGALVSTIMQGSFSLGDKIVNIAGEKSAKSLKLPQVKADTQSELKVPVIFNQSADTANLPLNVMSNEAIKEMHLKAIGDTNIQSNNNMRFEQQIDMWEKGQLKASDNVLLGDTPKVFENIGVAQNPIIITQDTLEKIVNPQGKGKGKHDLGIEVVKQIPSMLQDPQYIFKSATRPNDSVVAIVDAKDKQNRDVLVALRINFKQGFTTVNKISSAYGRNSAENFISRQIEGGNLLYTKKEKADNQLRSIGLQLPKENTGYDLSNNSIRQSPENSNTYSEKALRIGDNSSLTMKVGAEQNILNSKVLEALPESTNEITLEKLKTARQQLKIEQQKAERVVRYNQLSEKESQNVEGLLKQRIEVADLKNVSGIDIEKVLNVYDAKLRVQAQQKIISEFNRVRKERLREQSNELISESDKWTDKKAGALYAREIMERNFEDITSTKDASEINDYLFTSVHENEARATTLKNAYRNEIRKFKINPSESAYVQLKGEYDYYSKSQKVEDKKNADELALKIKKLEKKTGSKIDKSKCDEAIAVFRKIYDELFEQVNDALMANGYPPVEYRKGYFPHFQENQADTLVGKAAKALGFDVDTQELPTDIAGITHTFKPGKRWVGNFLERTGKTTTYDALKGFDRYIEGVADVIHHTEDIQKLRDFENAIRYKYSNDGIKQEVDEILAEQYDPEKERELIETVLSRSTSHLPHLVQEIRSYTDSLAGKKSIHDRSIESDTGRKIYSIVKAGESRIASNMVALNPGSWITNFIPLTQGYSEVSKKSMLKAMKEATVNTFKDDGFASKSAFLTNRRGSDPLAVGSIEKISSTLAKPMYYIDDFTANTLVRARTYDNKNKGMAEGEAIKEANGWVARVMADRSKGALPTLFERKNPLTKLFTMFQVEVNNQLSYLFKDIPRKQKEKGIASLVGAILKFTVGAFLYNELYEKLTGRRPALDPIGMVKGVIENSISENASFSKVVGGLGKDIAQNTPFIGGWLDGGRLPVSSAMPDVTKLLKLGDDIAPKKKAEIATKELAKPLLYLGMPVGGGQVKKIAEGTDSILKGGSYTHDNNGGKQLQFPVDNTGGNWAKGLLFGKYATDSAKGYVEKDFKPYSAKQTQAFDLLKDSGKKPTEAQKIIDEIVSFRGEGSSERKRDYLVSLDGVTPLIKSQIDDIIIGELKNKRDYTSSLNYKTSMLSESQQEKFADAQRQFDISIDEYNRYYNAIKNIKGDKDRNGKTIKGSTKVKKIKKLMEYGLSEWSANQLYDVLY